MSTAEELLSIGLEDAIVLPSTLNANTAWYDDDSFETSLTVDKRLSGGERLRLEAGYGKINLQVEKLTTRSLSVGFGQNPIDTWYFDGELSYWGNDEALTTHKLAVTLNYWWEPWQLAITPSFRRISAYGEDLSRSELITRPRFDIDDYGIQLDASFLKFENWSHRIHGTYHEYSEDLSRLDFNRLVDRIRDTLIERGVDEANVEDILTLLFTGDPEQLLLLSQYNERLARLVLLRRAITPALRLFDEFADAIAVTSSFELYSYGYEIGYIRDNLFLALDYTSSKSSVTETVSDAASFDVSYSKNQWNAGVRFSTFVDETDRWITQFYLALPLE